MQILLRGLQIGLVNKHTSSLKTAARIHISDGHVFQDATYALQNMV